MDQLVPLIAHPVVTHNAVLGGVLVEVVVDLVPPGELLCTLKQRDKGLALDILRDCHTSQLEEGGRKVDILRQLLDGSSSIEPLGEVHQERVVHRLLVHKALVKPPVLAHVEALVAEVEDDGCVPESLLLEVVDDPSDALIDRVDHLGVVAHVALVLVLHPLPFSHLAVPVVVRHGAVVSEELLPVLLVHTGEDPLVHPRVVGRVILTEELAVVGGVHVLPDIHLRPSGRRTTGIVIGKVLR